MKRFFGDKRSREERRIDEEALDWLTRQDVGLGPAEQDAFFDWLAKDARHGEWYAHREKTWKRFEPIVQWRPEHSEEPNPDLLAAPWTRSRRLLIGTTVGLAASIMLVLFLGKSWMADPASDIYLPTSGTMAESYERHRLSDGSQVELNRGAQIAVIFNDSERRVQLLSGEAFFTVAKNPNRPFIVNARGTDVRAVGTAFNMNLAGDTLEVLVTHGRVRLDSPTKRAPESALSAPRSNWPVPELGEGQRSVVSFLSSDAAPKTESVTADEIGAALSWRDQNYEFVAQPLSEIVEAINFHNSMNIVIRDQKLRDLEITHNVNLSDVEGFIRVLGISDGVTATVEEDGSIQLTYSQ